MNLEHILPCPLSSSQSHLYSIPIEYLPILYVSFFPLFPFFDSYSFSIALTYYPVPAAATVIPTVSTVMPAAVAATVIPATVAGLAVVAVQWWHQQLQRRL